VLSLYSVGSLDGVVLDSGDGVTHVVPVYRGYKFPHLTHHDFAGRKLTEFMLTLINQEGLDPKRPERRLKVTSSADFQIARELKEKHCRVHPTKFDIDMQLDQYPPAATGCLKDGTSYSLKRVPILCPEALFQPKALKFEVPSFPEAITNCIRKCSSDVAVALYSNIVLSGGTTMLPGIVPRLESELKELANPEIRDHIYIHNDFKVSRDRSVWSGGSIFASLLDDKVEGMHWITKRDYEESGRNTDILERCNYHSEGNIGTEESSGGPDRRG